MTFGTSSTPKAWDSALRYLFGCGYLLGGGVATLRLIGIVKCEVDAGRHTRDITINMHTSRTFHAFL